MGLLTKAGAKVRSRGMIYKAVEHSVIMYGIEGWVVTRVMFKVLEGFHHQVARRIMGVTEKRVADGEWVYPPVVTALESAELHLI